MYCQHSVDYGDSADHGDRPTMETVPTMEAMRNLVAMPTVVTVAKRQKQCCMERQHETNLSNEVMNVINFF